MLPSDSKAAVKSATQIIRDARVYHFHDQKKVAGRAIAQSLGAPGKIAWDVYLLYAKGSRWQEGAPVPADWAHQLAETTWAEPSRRHLGEALANKLRNALGDLLVL